MLQHEQERARERILLSAFCSEPRVSAQTDSASCTHLADQSQPSTVNPQIHVHKVGVSK